MKKNIQPRHLLPPAMLYFVVLYGISFVLDQLVAAGFGIPPPLVGLRRGLVIFFAVACGLHRAVDYNPFSNPRYCVWLARTPWTPAQPLPHGPVRLTIYDLVTVVLLVPFSLLNLMDDSSAGGVAVAVATPAVAFLVSYLTSLCLTPLLRGEYTTAFAWGFAMPLLIYPYFRPLVALAALAVLYVVWYIVFRKTMSRFPWNTRFWEANQSELYLRKAFHAHVVGWPFRVLTWKRTGDEIPLRIALALSLLLTWWVHVGSALVIGDLTRAAVVFLAVILSLLRLMGYVILYPPPITLLGRIFNFRFIIPKYDKVAVVPLLAVMVATWGSSLLVSVGLSSGLSMRVAVFLVFSLLLAGPPSPYAWRLTGGYSRKPTRIPQPINIEASLESLRV